MGDRLRDRLLPARDQGARPTCLSFAVAAAHGLETNKAAFDSLSEEMVHWGATRSERHPSGVSIEAVDNALKSFGQCALDLWPYKKTQVSFDPPEGALADGANRRARLELLRPDFTVIEAIVGIGVPVVLVVPVCEAFFVTTSGQIQTPDADEVIADLHAVLVTDCLNMPLLASAVEFRNSWGEEWGDDGYGYISRTYVDQYAVAAARLTLITFGEH